MEVPAVYANGRIVAEHKEPVISYLIRTEIDRDIHGVIFALSVHDKTVVQKLDRFARKSRDPFDLEPGDGDSLKITMSPRLGLPTSRLANTLSLALSVGSIEFSVITGWQKSPNNILISFQKTKYYRGFRGGISILGQKEKGLCFGF